jgi:hypothetical protein
MILGQQRTSKNKQFVLMGIPTKESIGGIEGKGEVWKGPYSEDKLKRIENRTEQLKKWKAPFIVYPEAIEKID